MKLIVYIIAAVIAGLFSLQEFYLAYKGLPSATSALVVGIFWLQSVFGFISDSDILEDNTPVTRKK